MTYPASAHNIYIFLDYFFLVFHSFFTLFNSLGWISRKTVLIHFITMNCTLASWTILGSVYGWGYCFCTDWHWQVLNKLGREPDSYSYIHYIILRITGMDLPPVTVDYCVGVTFALLYIISFMRFYKIYGKRSKSL